MLGARRYTSVEALVLAALTTASLTHCARIDKAPTAQADNHCFGSVAAPSPSIETPNPLYASLPPPPEINWDHPTNGKSEQSVEEAQKQVGFNIVEPKDLSAPQITVVNPAAELVDLRAISFFYSTDCGPVELTENVLDLTVDQFSAANQSFVDQLAKAGPSWPGYASIEKIRDGIQALLIIAPNNEETSLKWTDEGVEFILRGPSLSPDQAINLANGI